MKTNLPKYYINEIEKYDKIWELYQDLAIV